MAGNEILEKKSIVEYFPELKINWKIKARRIWESKMMKQDKDTLKKGEGGLAEEKQRGCNPGKQE